MRQLRKFYIGGQWVVPHDAAEHVMVDPSTERPVGTLTLADAHDVDSAVVAARASFPLWAETDPSERGALIGRMQKIYVLSIIPFEDEDQARQSRSAGSPFGGVQFSGGAREGGTCGSGRVHDRQGGFGMGLILVGPAATERCPGGRGASRLRRAQKLTLDPPRDLKRLGAHLADAEGDRSPTRNLPCRADLMPRIAAPATTDRPRQGPTHSNG